MVSIGTRGFSVARSVILLSAILASAILATGCGQSDGSSGEGSATSKPASTQPEKTTSQPMGSKPGTGNGSKEERTTVDSVDKGAEGRAGNAVAKNGKARAGKAVAGGGKARAGNIVAGDGGGGKAESRTGSAPRTGKVRLRITGTQGARFSGTCTANGKEEDIGGRVPERLIYRLDGGKLECNVRLRGPGTLEVALIGDGTRAVQTINSGRGAVDITYSSSRVSVTVK